VSKRPASKSIVANFAFSAADDGASTPPPVQPFARVGAGVIGATQRSLSEIREERDRLQALVASGGGLELETSLIDASPFPDRLPDDGERDFESFKKLIADEGQKIPIQVRKSPAAEGRYQIVYGHRRWRACVDLGIKVKATQVDLSDTELVVAQGIENAARQDLSWIERALFAWRMDGAGIKARDIRAALAVDDPELARLRAVCRALPVDVISAIGRAPKVGRPRWVELATAVNNEPKSIDVVRKTLSADKVSALPSDARFGLVLSVVKGDTAPERDSLELKSPAGEVIGKASFSASDVKLSLGRAHAETFGAFLKKELAALVTKFFAQEGST
jgi:ParB family chromosome partitioning protein